MRAGRELRSCGDAGGAGACRACRMCVLSIGGDANDDTLAAPAVVRLER
jgi:hypothetical protein